MTDLVRTCAWCPPGEARPAIAACPRCGRPMCDLHRIRESTPPSRCDDCEAEFRDWLNGTRQLGITVAWMLGPIAAGAALMAMGYLAAGAALGGLGSIAGISVRVYQRRRGQMRRRFLAEHADSLPPARVVHLPPGE